MNRFLAWAAQPGPTLVLGAARARLENGRIGPAPLKLTLTPEHRAQVGELLGRDWQVSGKAVTFPLLRKALLPYDLELETRLEEIGGPLVDRAAQRQAAAEARAVEDDAARAVLASVIDPGLVDEVMAACLPSSDPLPQARRLARVAERLPADGKLLSVLSADCFGDAHSLDRNRSLGQAAARLSLILAGQPVPKGSLQAEQWRAAWAGVGVSCDRVSTMVLTLNLPLGGSPAVRAVTAVTGEPVWLTLRMLEQADPPAPPLPEVFVCENPSVLESAADQLGERCAPLVCTFGRPSQTAHLLLRLLADSGTQLWIRADNDPAGRSFVNGLIATAPTAQPWRYEPGGPLYEEQLLTELVADLASRVQRTPEPAAPRPLVGEDELAGPGLRPSSSRG